MDADSTVSPVLDDQPQLWMNPVSFDYKIMNTSFNAKQKTWIHVYLKPKQVHSC